MSSGYKSVLPSIKQWYNKANNYWLNSDMSYDGVLSGYGKYSLIDINFSSLFLKRLIQKFSLKTQTVLDCGAGIGRVTKQLLLHYFHTVDLVDQSHKHIEKAQQLLKGTSARHFYVNGLQQFDFREKYDCIWIQWVLSQLTNEDAVKFLSKAKLALNKDGMIVLKENFSKEGQKIDKQDCSLVRTEQGHQQIFKQAGLTVLMKEEQLDWPQQLYPVKMYALV